MFLVLAEVLFEVFLVASERNNTDLLSVLAQTLYVVPLLPWKEIAHGYAENAKSVVCVVSLE